jgi:hypothetical protein
MHSALEGMDPGSEAGMTSLVDPGSEAGMTKETPGMTFQRARDDKREGIPGQARTTQIVNTS